MHKGKHGTEEVVKATKLDVRRRSKPTGIGFSFEIKEVNMATISFEKEMRLNQEESKWLLNFLNKDTKNRYKVKTPAPKKASIEDLKKIFKSV